MKINSLNKFRLSKDKNKSCDKLQQIEENKSENIFEESERLESSKNNEILDEVKEDIKHETSNQRAHSAEDSRASD